MESARGRYIYQFGNSCITIFGSCFSFWGIVLLLDFGESLKFVEGLHQVDAHWVKSNYSHFLFIIIFTLISTLLLSKRCHRRPFVEHAR